jgi:hypothetical protein
VPDRRDRRNGAGGDGANDALVGEGEEVLEAAAAAGQDDDVHGRVRHQSAERVDDQHGRARPLHSRLGHDEARGRESRGDGAHEVAAGGSVAAGEQANGAREARQRTLALGCEEAFGGEGALQAFQRGHVLAEPEALDRRRAKAELAPRFVDRRPAEDVHALAVVQVEGEPVVPATVERGGQAGAGARILEREEDARPARVAAQLRQLAFDPDLGQTRDVAGDAAVERRDRVDLAVPVHEGLDLRHARGAYL